MITKGPIPLSELVRRLPEICSRIETGDEVWLVGESRFADSFALAPRSVKHLVPRLSDVEFPFMPWIVDVESIDRYSASSARHLFPTRNQQQPVRLRRGGHEVAIGLYPDELEESDCCRRIRRPSRSWPFSLLKHCYTLKHVAHLYGVDESALRKLVRKLDKEAAA